MEEQYSMVNSLRSAAKGLVVLGLLAVALILPSTASALNPTFTNTQAAQEVGPTGVTLRGIIGATEPGTTYWFEYGSTTTYGTKTEVKTLNLPYYPEVAFPKERLEKAFEPGTTFHFRMIATDNKSTVVGVDKTFVVHTFEAEKSPVVLKGQLAAGTKVRVGTKEGSFECASAELDMGNVTLVAATSFTVNPYLEKCGSGGSYLHGCQFKYTIGQNQVPTAGTLDLVNCEPEMKSYSGTICGGGFGIPAQSLGLVTYSTEGSGSSRAIVASVNDTNISYKCGASVYTGGTFEATWKINAFNGAGLGVGLFVK
jgi:hypothetical protein